MWTLSFASKGTFTDLLYTYHKSKNNYQEKRNRRGPLQMYTILKSLPDFTKFTKPTKLIEFCIYHLSLLLRTEMKKEFFSKAQDLLLFRKHGTINRILMYCM